MDSTPNIRPYNSGLIAGMLTSAIVATLSGVLLLPAYRSQPGEAYASVSAISHSGGLAFLRGIHHWASALLLIQGTLYILVGLFRAAYRKPGQWLWIASIGLFLVGLLLQLTGHLLPMDVQAVRTAVVETGIAADAPVIGTAQANFVRGGDSVGPSTVHLWYLLHVGVLAVVVLGFVIAVVLIARRLKVPVGRVPWAISSLILLILAGVLVRPPLGSAANASDYSGGATRPEWYVLPLHSLLSIAQNVNPKFAFVGTIVIPALVILLLVVLPWVHKRESGPVAKSLGVIGALVLIGLSLYSSPSAAPPVGDQQVDTVDSGNTANIKLDPTLVARGKALFDQQGCSDCHTINGHGGKIGPDLTGEASRGHSLDWEVKHLQDPKSMSPGSTMPSFGKLSQPDLQALAQYVLSKK